MNRKAKLTSALDNNNGSRGRARTFLSADDDDQKSPKLPKRISPPRKPPRPPKPGMMLENYNLPEAKAFDREAVLHSKVFVDDKICSEPSTPPDQPRHPPPPGNPPRGPARPPGSPPSPPKPAEMGLNG